MGLCGAGGRPRGPAIDIGAVEVLQIIVTNTNDTGAGSLRQAITDANSTAGDDTITFDATVFATAKTIGVATALPGIFADMTIQGTGTAKLTVSRNVGAPQFGMFFISNGSGITSQALTLTDMTISGGDTTADGGAFNVLLASTLTLDRVVLTGNKAAQDGGAISVDGGTLIVRNTTIAGNTAVDEGGGIATRDGAVATENSTISGNTAGHRGGGIYATFNSPVTLTNSTISGNTGGGGGGIYLFAASGKLDVRNSTVTANTATSGNGGGFFFANGSPAVSFESSIFSGNQAISGPDFASGGVPVSLKTSLIGKFTGTTIDLGGNLFSIDPLLGGLANNGGPTQTHAILPGSPLINAGSNPAALITDQRGAGFLRSVGGAVDIGAFESTLPPTVRSVVVNGGAVQRSRVTSLTVTFDQQVTIPTPASAFTLRRNSDSAAVTLAASVDNSGPATVVTLTFIGGAVEIGSLADGRYTLVALASQITNLDGNVDGIAGGNYVLVGDPAVAPKLFRFFGDNDGDGDNDGVGFLAFRNTSGLSSVDPGFNPNFDFDNDGDVDAQDFLQYRSRFGGAV